MAQNLETTLTDADRALYHTYGVAIRHAEAQIWGNSDLDVFTDVSTGASCVIAAPNPDLLLGVVRDARGLHVERHIEMAGSPCDSFTLTREGGTCWEYMASGERVPYEMPALPRIVLGSILRRFTDPHPGRGGYLQFLIGKETEPVVQRLAERGHVLRHPMLTRALGEWGILASAY